MDFPETYREPSLSGSWSEDASIDAQSTVDAGQSWSRLGWEAARCEIRLLTEWSRGGSLSKGLRGWISEIPTQILVFSVIFDLRLVELSRLDRVVSNPFMQK